MPSGQRSGELVREAVEHHRAGEHLAHQAERGGRAVLLGDHLGDLGAAAPQRLAVRSETGSLAQKRHVKMVDEASAAAHFFGCVGEEAIGVFGVEGALEGTDDPAGAERPLFGFGCAVQFGAGVLVGWTESGQRPQFDIVTGLSAWTDPSQIN